MFRLILPYSIYALVIALLAGAPIWIAALIGGLVEFVGATALLIRLTSVKEFKYHSFFGQILKQFTLLDEIGVGVIGLIVGVRLVSFLFIGTGLWFVGVPLFFLACLHYLPE